MADFSWYTSMPKEERDSALSIIREGQPVEPLEFERVESDSFVGEVTIDQNDLIYHIFPKEVRSDWEDLIGDSFLETFKNAENRMMANFVKELGAWAVCVKGYGSNPLASSLRFSVLETLESKLKNGR